MTHNIDRANYWLNLLKEQALPQKEIFLAQLKHSVIGDLCQCGCNSFGLTIPEEKIMPPLQAKSGLFCELVFETDMAEEIDVLVLTNEKGYLVSIDVTFGSCNHGVIPDGVGVIALKGLWTAQ